MRVRTLTYSPFLNRFSLKDCNWKCLLMNFPSFHVASFGGIFLHLIMYSIMVLFQRERECWAITFSSWKSTIESSSKFLRGYLHLEIMNIKLSSYLLVLLIKGLVGNHIKKRGRLRKWYKKYWMQVVMMITKDNAWRMCLDYRDLYKISIKDKLSVLNIDELHRVAYFTKLDLKSGYHEIKLIKEYIPKQLLEHKGTMSSCSCPLGWLILLLLKGLWTNFFDLIYKFCVGFL